MYKPGCTSSPLILNDLTANPVTMKFGFLVSFSPDTQLCHWLNYSITSFRVFSPSILTGIPPPSATIHWIYCRFILSCGQTACDKWLLVAGNLSVAD